MLYILIYLVALFLITWLSRREMLAGVLKPFRKSSWLVKGISLFMYYVTVEEGQLAHEILSEHGIWGMWMLWTGMFTAFFVPIVLAPIWHKLQFTADNEFTLFRFSGSGGKALFHFRACYVGMVVVTLLLGFQVLAFSKVLTVFFAMEKVDALMITGALLLAFAFKNSFSVKLKTDLLHAVGYFLALATMIYFVWEYTGGPAKAVQQLHALRPETLVIFPQNSGEQLITIVFLCVQWWSLQLFDGGGPEMMRFVAAKDGRSATWTGVFSSLLSTGFLLITMLLVFMVLSISASHPGKADFWTSTHRALPSEWHMMVVLGSFGAFITTAESLMSWGAGFWSGTVYRWAVRDQNANVPAWFIFGCMALLCASGALTAFASDSLQGIIKWIFALSAGVAPVFVLRWFWMRINGWSQLVAMVCVPFLNLLLEYTAWHQHLGLPSTGYGPYTAKILLLTPMTMLVWLAVTFLTPTNHPETIAKFREVVPSFRVLLPKIVLALLAGAAYFWAWIWVMEGLVGWLSI